VIAAPKSKYGNRLEVLAEENWSSLGSPPDGSATGRRIAGSCDRTTRLKVCRLSDHPKGDESAESNDSESSVQEDYYPIG